MRVRLLLAVSVVSVVCLAMPLLAQQREGRGRGGPPGGGGFGFFGGGFGPGRLMLLRIPEVQKELDLVEEQLAAIQKLQEELAPMGRGGFGPGGPGGPEGRRGRGPGRDGAFQNPLPADWFFVQQEQPGRGRRGGGGFGGGFGQLTEEQRREFEQQRQERARQEIARLKEILLPHQMKRLNEIYVQAAGVNALQDEEIAKELGITDAQKNEMARVRQENQETMAAQMRELFQGGAGGDRDAARAKMEQLRREADQKILALLTADQKQKFEEMKGKPFDLPEGALRGGFGRGGPGGPGGPGGRRGPGGDNRN